MRIGTRIKERRLSMRKSLEWLAVEIGTTRQTIYKYEEGIIANIPQSKLMKIAKALDIQYIDLVTNYTENFEREYFNLTYHTGPQAFYIHNIELLLSDYILKNGNLFKLVNTIKDIIPDDLLQIVESFDYRKSVTNPLGNFIAFLSLFLSKWDKNEDQLMKQNKLAVYKLIEKASGGLYSVTNDSYLTSYFNDLQPSNLSSFKPKINQMSVSEALQFNRDLKVFSTMHLIERFEENKIRINSILNELYSCFGKEFEHIDLSVRLFFKNFDYDLFYRSQRISPIPILQFSSANEKLELDFTINGHSNYYMPSRIYLIEFLILVTDDSLTNVGAVKGDTCLIEASKNYKDGDICFICFKDSVPVFRKVFFHDDKKLLTLLPLDYNSHPTIVSYDYSDLIFIGKLTLISKRVS